MESTPEQIFKNCQEGKINKKTAVNLLTSFIENSDDSYLRIHSIQILLKMNVCDDEIFELLENLLISDQDEKIRSSAALYIKKYFYQKSLKLMKWALEHEEHYLCYNIILNTLVKMNDLLSKEVLLNEVKKIRKIKYLDIDKRIENKKFKKAIKRLFKRNKIEELSHEHLAEIIMNFRIISELTRKFYSVYFELDNSLVIKLDLADVEYEVRGWKSDFKNNIKDTHDIAGLEFLKHLKHLNLSNNQISDIKELIKLKNLTHLFISNNTIKDLNNFDYIQDIPKLKFIDISGNPIIKQISPEIFNKENFKGIEIVVKKYLF
jgi:hypothetical protein